MNAGGKSLTPLRPEDDQGEAAEQRERAEGHDERRQAAAGDEQAVEQAAERADDEDERDRRSRAGRRPPTGSRGAALASPAIDSTDRSISPAMMIRVIGRAMIATSIRAAIRFAKLPGVRKNGDRALPSDDQPEQGDDQERLPARQSARPAPAGAARGRPRRSSSRARRGRRAGAGGG